MTKKTRLEKTYRGMREQLNENKQSDSGKPHADDDPKVEAEDASKQKKGVEPEKPSTAANRPADDSKKGLDSEAGANSAAKKTGLKEAKKSKKNEAENPFAKKDDKEEDDEEDKVDESKEDASDRIKRGVPAKKGALEEAKAKKRRADVSETDDEDEDDLEEGEEEDDDDEDEKMDEETSPTSEELSEAEDAKLESELAETTEKAVSDMGDLLEGQGSLQEDHKEQVKTLFEAALSDKTKVIRENLQEQHERKLAEAIDASDEALVESLNTYLDKVVAEWLDENRMELEQNVRTEITESFLGAMKHVFEDHYVDVPEEKLDLVENILDENEEMEEKLNEEMTKRMNAENALGAYKKSEVINSLSEGLTLTEKERLVELTEEIGYENDESFSKKVATIKEGFIKIAPSQDDVEILNEGSHGGDGEESAILKRYGGAIKSMSVDKFSMNKKRKDK